MKGFKTNNLDSFLEAVGEDRTKAILADYLCPLNPDVENFLKHNAIPFSRQGLAKTHLVFASKNDRWVLVGYFTLATKVLLIKRSKKLSSNLSARIRKFARIIDETNTYQISAPLIAQLGKNFANGNNKLITGDELLKIAYLECEDKPHLLNFYERNGFREFDRRSLDKTDRETFKSDYLVQMLRYF